METEDDFKNTEVDTSDYYAHILKKELERKLFNAFVSKENKNNKEYLKALGLYGATT